MLPDRLILFAKNPRLGRVKTRLAATLGDAAALEAYLLLLQHTRSVSEAVRVERFIYYSDEMELGDAFHAERFHKRVQRGGDLGARMENAFRAMFDEGAARVCIIGSDCAELQASHLEEAFEALHNHPLVMGPTHDGGYYLLGMNRMAPELFRGKQWSTDTVAKDTLQDAASLGLEVALLPRLSDVDTEEDWRACPLLGR